MKISILMLVHNAPFYVFKSIYTLKKTKSKVKYELVVVDNKSGIFTRVLVKLLYVCKMIDKLKFNDTNALFAKGNNIASMMTDADTTHYLLLNSDVKIMNAGWLDKLIKIHPKKGGGKFFRGCRKRTCQS